ncbi:MAG: glycosyltransferase family 2 protein [Campylobacterota bacterium]|nr:glycosyltransferase family 2 protein [Campylobacterota bacterium]
MSCVVVPVYNSPYIQEVVEDVLSHGYKVIVVDDGSDIEVRLDALHVELIRHSKNMGKGEAILSGAKRAKELGYISFVTVDADKQHLAHEIVKLIDAYSDGTIVIGNRDFSSKNVPKSSKFGRAFSNFWVKLETLKSLGDTQSGFRLYPTTILDLNIKNRRFDFEIEVLALHVYAKGSILDVEVECYYPPQDERISHFDKLHDNIRISLVHTRLLIQRYLFFRGWLWN